MNITFALALYSAIPLWYAGGLTPSPEVAVVGPTVRLGDFNGDGLPDAYIVHPARGDRLLRNQGDGTFADVTEQSGLSGIRASRMALWQDYDRDGALDLFVCSAAGMSRLLRNLGNGSFVDATLEAGIAHTVQSDLYAAWIDYDADRLPDLHIVTDSGDRIYHNCGGGRFELADLGPQDTRVTQVFPPEPADRELEKAGVGGGSAAATTASTSTPTGPHAPATATSCFSSITDQAVPATCVQASSVPTLGSLYPLSNNLNVSTGGNVGIGTSAPAAKLDVAGAVRTTGQITSTVATGTSPLAVTSTTKVTNLNVDQLDGLDSSTFSQLGSSIESSEITDATINASDLADASVGTSELLDGSIANGDVSSSAAISGSKIAPDFGSQDIVTFGTVGIGTTSPNSLTQLHLYVDSAGPVGTTFGGAHLIMESGGFFPTNRIDLRTISGGSSLIEFKSPANRGSIDYNHASNRMVFATDGVERMRVDSAGKVGIGTFAPANPLHVSAPGTDSGGVAAVPQVVAHFTQTTSNQAGAVSIDAPTGQDSILYLAENGAAVWDMRNDAGASDDLRFNHLGATTVMTLEPSGNVGIGTSSPGFLLHVNGSAGKPGGGTWTAVSDERLKKNVADVRGALEKLLALRGVTFEYLDAESIGELEGERLGMIAQEVEKVMPDWVETGPDGYKRLTVRGFEALTVEALRELRAEKDREFAHHEAELAKRDAELAGREARIDELERRVTAQDDLLRAIANELKVTRR